MQVLVCGADGFIGRHIAAGLSAAGHRVVGTVFGRAPRQGEVSLDLTRPSDLAELDVEADAVVNAAGIVDGKSSARAIYAVNAAGASRLVAWARRRSVKHFVQVSSVAVYGPLVLGEGRPEQTPRMALLAGFPYMRSKALAERSVERSGIAHTILRPPAVMGAGDTVLSGGFTRALQNGGLPLVPGASGSRRVTLAFAQGLSEVAAVALERGPLNRPVHVVNAHVSLRELAELYASRLKAYCSFRPVSWSTVLSKRNDFGFSWLAASARFGQHYSETRLTHDLSYRSTLTLDGAVQASLSGLQGGG